jgi:hypothetical protein
MAKTMFGKYLVIFFLLMFSMFEAWLLHLDPQCLSCFLGDYNLLLLVFGMVKKNDIGLNIVKFHTFKNNRYSKILICLILQAYFYNQSKTLYHKAHI